MASLLARRVSVRHLSCSTRPTLLRCDASTSASPPVLCRHHYLTAVPPATNSRSHRPSVICKHFSNSLALSAKKQPALKETAIEEEEEDTSGETDEESDDELGDDYKEVTLYLQSLRLDAFVGKAFSLSRAEAELQLHKNNVYLNGMLVKKKSEQVLLGDRIDLVVSRAAADENLATVNRIVVRQSQAAKVHDDGRKALPVLVRRYSNVLTNDYPVF